MTRQFLPGAVHEATGIALGVLAVVHNARNRRWWATLPRGRWTARRTLLTLVDVALAAVCAGCIVCGLGMSGVAVALGLAGRTMVLRSVHMALVHWAFVLAGVHLGMHARQITGRMLRQRGAGATAGADKRVTPVAARFAVALAAAALAAYGTYAFVKLDFPGYLTGQVRFAFIDPTQSVALFVLDHLAVFLLFALVGWALWHLAGHHSPTRSSRRHQ